VDRLFEEIAVEADVARRKALIFRFQEIVADELPVIPLMLSRAITVYNRKGRRSYGRCDRRAEQFCRRLAAQLVRGPEADAGVWLTDRAMRRKNLQP
jgi:hypothetical protein